MKKWRLTKLFCRNSFRLTDKICYPQSSYINLLSPFFIYFLLATRWNSKMHYALLWLIKLIKMLMKMNLEVDSLSRLTSVVTYLKVSLPVSNVARKCSIISPKNQFHPVACTLRLTSCFVDTIHVQNQEKSTLNSIKPRITKVKATLFPMKNMCIVIHRRHQLSNKYDVRPSIK